MLTFGFSLLKMYQGLYQIVWKLQYKDINCFDGLHGIGMEIA